MHFSLRHRLQLAPFVKILLLLLIIAIFNGCNPFITRFIVRSIEHLPDTPDTVIPKIEHPIFSQVGLSILWVGHSTCFIQIGDKIFLTDPIFTSTAGLIAKRSIEAGIQANSIDRLDYILISHLHFDHLNYTSLSLLPKAATIILPPGGLEYTPEFGFSDYRELSPWTVFEADGVRITAVPVQHFNGRYGFDNTFSGQNTYTGYVIEYKGKTVLFTGDTGYDHEKFKEIGRRFLINAALIPIAPIEPHDFMKWVHADPKEALQIFEDVAARIMIPIHHRTFEQGMDSTLTYAQDQLKTLSVVKHLQDRIFILRTGEQRIIVPEE
jgi:N-acyl-phosphatidylethanolamine-hydrolysing phospholipase D